MTGKYLNIENTAYKDRFISSLTDVRKGKGSIICVSGEGGFGKTHLLNSFLHETVSKDSAVAGVYVLCDSPVGSFKVGNLQPMLPFSRAIGKILAYNKDEKSPEKRFFRNVGMTVLASLPVAGEVFYAVKELSKDWRQYKKERSSYSLKNINSVTTEYYDSLLSLAEQVPIVLLLDDMHWSDAQSVELLNLLVQEIASLPILIIFSYRKSFVEAHNSSLLSFIEHSAKSGSVYDLELKGFDRTQVNRYMKEALSSYKTNSEFEDWLFNQTGGVPGVLYEYVKYFEQNPPFTSDGKLKKDFFENENLPSSFQTFFAQVVGNLNEEERNTLAICSSEGREFTAFIIAQLLNTDVLTAIKKLRALQNKTGIIRSKGSQLRYGIKTTTYEFNQAFYHNLFEKSLEYEEYIDLHSRIAGLLKQRYEESESEFIRQELAPYIAAHSTEAGDIETAKSMLLLAARAAQKFGSSEVIRDFYENFSKITDNTKSGEQSPEEEIMAEMMQSYSFNEPGKNNEEVNENTEDKPVNFEIHDFNAIRNAIVDYYHKENFTAATELAISYLDNHSDGLELTAVAQIYALAIRSYIGLNDLHKAESYCRDALALVESGNDAIAECFVYNVCSILHSVKKDDNEAQNYLTRVARKAMSLPPELRLLTLSNMAIMMEKANSKDADKYYDAVRKISSALNFQDFAKEVFKSN